MEFSSCISFSRTWCRIQQSVSWGWQKRETCHRPHSHCLVTPSCTRLRFTSHLAPSFVIDGTTSHVLASCDPSGWPTAEFESEELSGSSQMWARALKCKDVSANRRVRGALVECVQEQLRHNFFESFSNQYWFQYYYFLGSPTDFVYIKLKPCPSGAKFSDLPYSIYILPFFDFYTWLGFWICTTNKLPL